MRLNLVGGICYLRREMPHICRTRPISCLTRRASMVALGIALCLLGAPSRASAKNVLVIGPHEDDETLIAAGRVRASILAGDTVTIALITNGDISGTATGIERQGESVAAAQLLGLTEQDVIFLGYGDGSLLTIYDSASGTQVYRSSAGQTATYGSRGLGRMDYHRFLYGTAGAYNRNTLLGDVQALIGNMLPDEIYTVSHFDDHPDHQAAALFVAEALVALKRSGVPLNTKLYQSIVWAPWYGGCSDPSWPQVDSSGFTPTQPFYKSPCFDVTQLEWERILRFTVPPEMQTTSTSTNLKYRAIRAYASQVNAFLTSFARKDEFFWLTDFGLNLAITAQVTVSSENAGGGQSRMRAVDGVADGAPRDPAREWVTIGQLAGAWIQLAWPAPVSVAQVNLWDRPSTSENVLGGTLTFSDGSRITVGALPADGSVWPVTFTPRTVNWVRFTIDRAQGSATGLSEIEVLGRLASSPANLPPIFLWGPVPTPTSINSAQTASLFVAGNDINGDSYAYDWVADGGSIQGSGASVIFAPPPLTSSRVFTITSQILDGRGGSTSNVNFVTVAPAAAGTVALASVSVSPSSVIGGSGSTGTVTLSAAAPSGGALVTLSDNSAAATVPASVTVAQGATSATFPVTTSGVAAQTAVTITGTQGGATRTTTLAVNPPLPVVTGLALIPAGVVGGASSTGTVTLSGPAPAGGAQVALSDNSASATVPASVTVAQGATTATFAVATTSVAAVTFATITASYNASTQTAALTINPPLVSSLTLAPTSVVGGASSTGTVTLSAAAPTGGALVTLSSNSASAAVPASVTVAQGADRKSVV